MPPPLAPVDRHFLFWCVPLPALVSFMFCRLPSGSGGMPTKMRRVVNPAKFPCAALVPGWSCLYFAASLCSTHRLGVLARGCSKLNRVCVRSCVKPKRTRSVHDAIPSVKWLQHFPQKAACCGTAVVSHHGRARLHVTYLCAIIQM